ncbi:hypothetical protein EMPS_06502 [Entomortierella parvispora]|uniref:Karyogamy protein n=1 Tax=Entomortierella parvispora TaxID=205924 RepID=A0A9P3HCG6_9FUNG|nr:hypothetical protein EMPS_06502 [Entomortierella parvispora]
MASISQLRLDGLSEVTELERIPLPYKTLYHTLFFKNDMPVDLLQERHRTGSEQLLTWIQAALALLDTVAEESAQRQRQNLDDDEKEEQDEELEAEIQDVVSGFGHYEPTIESSIEILLQLEECVADRLSTRSPNDSISSLVDQNHLSLTSTSKPLPLEQVVHISPAIETILEQWSRLRKIIDELSGSVREHQRLRDGIQNVRNISEQTRQASGILEKCLQSIAADKQRTSELALSLAQRDKNSKDLSLQSELYSLTPYQNSTASLSKGGTMSLGVDSNDMLELDSRIGLLSLQIDTLQKTYPECTRTHRIKTLKAHKRDLLPPTQARASGTIAEKKQCIWVVYQELLGQWDDLRTGKEQLWRDLEECDRWRARIEKMAKQIESMLDPVEIFYKMCANMLSNLDRQSTMNALLAAVAASSPKRPSSPKGPSSPKSVKSSPRSVASRKSGSFMGSAAGSTAGSVPASPRSVKSTSTVTPGTPATQATEDDVSEPINLETLWSTIQELDEKQTMVAPAIENMFWVQEGEIQHRTKTAAFSPTTPTTAVDRSVPPPSFALAMELPSPLPVDSSPLYPNIELLERQRHLKARWSNLKTSLDAVGTRLHAHHTTLKEKANEEERLALAKKDEAENRTLVGSGNSIDGQGWRSPSSPSSPNLRRSGTAPHASKSPSSPTWSPSARFLRGKLVSSQSMDSTAAVRKYMLIKSDKPQWEKPRPWCPSVSVSSPGMPGFPLQTSSWGYFFLGPSTNEENFGELVATPAPPPKPKPTPPSSATKNKSSKILDRPPFSPGGNRGYTALSKPPVRSPPMPARSVSVAGGDFKSRCMSPPNAPGGGRPFLRRSTSTHQLQGGQGKKSNGQAQSNTKSNTNNSNSNSNNNNNNNNGKNNGAQSRRNSIQPQQRGAWAASRRTSISSSSSSEDETIREFVAASRRGSSSSSCGGALSGYGSGYNSHKSGYRSSRGSLPPFGRHGLAPLTTLTDSTSSLDSMMSTSFPSSFGARGRMMMNKDGGYESSSMSSSVGGRSPSPFGPMFGSSFAAARSTAALHSALMASMSSASAVSHTSSSSSLRFSPASPSQGRDSRSSRGKNPLQHQQRQPITLGTSSASSWMSMNTGSLISALSFTVPTYNFEEDFSNPFVNTSREETLVTM